MLLEEWGSYQLYGAYPNVPPLPPPAAAAPPARAALTRGQFYAAVYGSIEGLGDSPVPFMDVWRCREFTRIYCVLEGLGPSGAVAPAGACRRPVLEHDAVRGEPVL